MQLTHYNNNFKKHSYPITLISDNVGNALNIGSLFRLADAFGVEKLVFCGKNVSLGRKMTKTSRATEKYVNYELNTSTVDAIANLKSKNYLVVALEITSNSQSLFNTNFNLDRPIAIVVGDENFGVSDKVLKLSDVIVHIDMFGNNSSMNVVQATSILLYELVKQYRNS